MIRLLEYSVITVLGLALSLPLAFRMAEIVGAVWGEVAKAVELLPH